MKRPRTYRMSVAARRLGLTKALLRTQLRHLGAITEDKRANPLWVRQGWLHEEQFQYQHPAVGWRWCTRIEITESGMTELFSRIHNKAA